MIHLSQDYEPRFSGFHDLMKFRVREILLVSSLYDAFVLEEDGRLSERIFSEYLDLNLRFVPRITRVSTAEEGLKAMERHSFDLVITMTRLADMDPFEFGRKVKEQDPGRPVILLTFERLTPDLVARTREGPSIDKVFYWTGDTKILLALIKYVEDWKNAPDDYRQGVQIILMVEDSPKYFSSFLPIIYTEIMTQTRRLISEGVNDLHRLLRMRARPRILMAETFEDAVEIYETYKHNLLGVISDIRFPRDGALDGDAGFRLADRIKQEVKDLPILLQSSNDGNRGKAHAKDLAFLHKNSPSLLYDLRAFILENFGFGDFVFRYPDGREIGRARTYEEFEKMIHLVPDESLEYHGMGNHFSRWLRARTEFRLADEIRDRKVSDYANLSEIRRYISQVIERLIQQNLSGVILDFGHSRLDSESSFIRLGGGSLGGKARGIAFVNALLGQTDLSSVFEKVEIKTPQSFVLSSTVFEEFVEMNGLGRYALAAGSDEEIAERFKASPLPRVVARDLKRLLKSVRYPLAVRSSSLLEDSQNLPFAGLYRTYILPNNHRSLTIRLKQLCDAVKLVFASVFYRSPREYVNNTAYRIEEEKMAVLVQELAGQAHGDLYYPVVSGVAQSYNFYPISHMEPEDGIAHLAMGLGRTVVEGERIYRFSPAYPRIPPPAASPGDFMNQSQSTFYALDLSASDVELGLDDSSNLRRETLARAEQDGTLYFVGSTFSAQDGVIRDTLAAEGPRAVTFAGILKFDFFPLAEILKELLDLGVRSFGTHVEIEFALNLFREEDRRPQFHFLQIRPMIAGGEKEEVRVDPVSADEAVVACSKAMGNGVYTEIRDLVALDPQAFDIAKSRRIAAEVGELNQRFIDEDRDFALITFGRLGTSDPWLGVPVQWSQISRAKLIVEANTDTLKVEPSQGCHFFHNLVSLRMGYFHIRRVDEENFVDWAWLDELTPFGRTTYTRHYRFDTPLLVKIDGRSSRGVVYKPKV